MTYCHTCDRNFASQRGLKQHLKAKSHREAVMKEMEEKNEASSLNAEANPFSPQPSPAPVASSWQPNTETRPFNPQPNPAPVASSWQPNTAAELVNIMAQAQKEMITALQLPKGEIVKFDGNPLQYFIFMRQFQDTVDSQKLPNGTKLNMLLQHCTGRARHAVESCLAMDPNQGYDRAMTLLRKRFGDSYQISETWVSKISQGPAINSRDGIGLQNLADDIDSCVNNLEGMNLLAEVNNQRVLVKIIDRLPSFLRDRWVREVHRSRRLHGKLLGIEDLAEFVSQAAEEANDPIYGKPSDRCSPPQRKSNAHQNYMAVDEKKMACPDCNQEHALYTCKAFKERPLKEKLGIVRSNRLCYACLQPGHGTDKCSNKKGLCQVPDCRYKHSRLLHFERAGQGKGQDQEEKPFPQQHQTMCNAAEPATAVLPIIPIKVRPTDGGPWLKVFALLDNGSTTTFCSSKLQQKLNVKGNINKMMITTLGGVDKQVKTQEINLEISSIDGQRKFSVSGVQALKELPINPRNMAIREELQDQKHLLGLNIPLKRPDEVELLIGQDNAKMMIPMDIRYGEENSPYAVKTPLGWVVSGSIAGRAGGSTSCFVDVELHKKVERFWKIDDIESRRDALEMSVNDEKALKVMNDSIVHLPDEHFQMALPWKGSQNLPENVSQARNRLKSLSRRLEKDPDLHGRYTEYMEGLLKKGIAEKIPKGSSSTIWYLPHFPVFHPQKPGKVRVVFDCAAKHQDVSLNDKLFQGPDLTNSLVGVLTRFREKPVAMVADIEGMFNQVKVIPEHRDALRFLWWPNGNLAAEPAEFRMTTHLFGAVSSPSCCNFALRKTIEDNSKEFDAETLHIASRNFYVDDLLVSVENADVAVKKMESIRKLLARGGFRLTKWFANSPEVIQAVPEEERSASVKDLDFESNSLPTEKTLGLQWCSNQDAFTYRAIECNKPSTRRGILSVMSSLYDPLGGVSPFIFPIKVLLQSLCKDKFDWDEKIPDSKLKEWQRWKEDLPKLASFKLPRCLVPADLSKPIYQLHHFSDASEKGYGAVSYLRAVTSDKIHCTFLMAKSRVAPIKTQPIPRLELAGAAVGAKMDSVLREELNFNIADSYFWTDSMIVLGYINNTQKRYKTFVANRLSTIHQLSSASQWHHVRSEQNPADDLSRGLTATEIIESTRWLQGPSFLWTAESKWPSQAGEPKVADNDPEIKKKDIQVYHVEAKKSSLAKLMEKYSSWNSLKRAIAWLLKFKRWLQTTKKNEQKEITVSDLKEAEIEIIKLLQRETFRTEFRILESNASDEAQKLLKSSPLYKLAPFVADNGLLQVGGRLHNAAVAESRKHPSILPKHHHVVSLIVRDIHNAGHMGCEYVLSKLRMKYWPVGGRQTVKQEIRECRVCRRYKSHPSNQRMADLPACRVAADTPPFTFTGTDLFGPIKVKRGRSELKRYGCLFTCMTVRAIHLELLDSMDTDSFLNALHRFMSRRGRPKQIWCDNGTNFVGAQRQLRASLKTWNQSQIHDFLLQREIEWHFIPPSASHMGGAWERMIGTVKKVLAPLTNQQTLNDDALATLFCQVEDVVNDRPLTTVPEDPNDYKVLTPNQLLKPGTDAVLPQGVFPKQDVYSRKRWRQIQFLADTFWKRWKGEYLPTLQARNKWIHRQSNLVVGDVVLLVEDSPRNCWPLARVTEVFHSQDGDVRSVKVKARSSELIRPITKVCLLESDVEKQ